MYLSAQGMHADLCGRWDAEMGGVVTGKGLVAWGQQQHMRTWGGLVGSDVGMDCRVGVITGMVGRVGLVGWW